MIHNKKKNLLFQVKTENPPLLVCLLIYHFLSSVSIKPMTSMLVFLWCVCMWGVGGVALGAHEMGRHKLAIIIIINHGDLFQLE